MVLAHSSIHSAAGGESADNEGVEGVADVVANDQIGEIIKLGGLTIDDDKRRAIALGHKRKTCGRPHHQRRADREKQVATLG